MNSCDYKKRIIRTLEVSRATLSPAAYELLARALQQELARIEAELERYKSALCEDSLAQTLFGKLAIDIIERHVSMLVKPNVSVFFNTPARAVPYASAGIASTQFVVMPHGSPSYSQATAFSA